MKKLFVLFLMLAGMARADSRYSYVYVHPNDFMQGDAVSLPLAASNGDNTLYFSRYLSNTVATMAAATGVTMAVNIQMPTSMKPGSTVTLGVTVMYAGVTNSAVLSPTAKVQTTTYIDSKANTSFSNVQILAPVALTDAQLYGGPFDLELGTITNVYPADVVTLHLTRALGSNQVLHFYRVWAKVEPTKGWFW